MFIRGFAKLLLLVSLAIIVACSGKTVTSYEDGPPNGGGAPPLPAAGRPNLVGGSGPAISGAGGASAGTGGLPASGGSVSYTALSIEPTSVNLFVGGSVGLVVRGARSDGTSVDLTARVTFGSTNLGVALLMGNFVIARSPGMTTVSASFAGLYASIPVRVEEAQIVSLDIASFARSCRYGEVVTFEARATLKDGSTRNVTSQVKWSTSQPLVLLSQSEGSAVCISAGAVQVQATLGALQATHPFEVTGRNVTGYSLTPSGYTRVGRQDGLLLVASYADGSTLDLSSYASFESDKPSVVSLDGWYATAWAVGEAKLTAKLGDTPIESVKWQVSDAKVSALHIAPAQLDLVFPATGRFVATAKLSDGTTQDVSRFADWSADNQLVNLTDGFVTANGVGLDRVLARLDDVEAPATVTVGPGKPDQVQIGVDLFIPAGVSVRVWATGLYPDGSSLDVSSGATWHSGDNGIASFPSPASPWIVGNHPGSTTYTAAVGAQTSEPNGVTVTNAVLTSIRFGSSLSALPVNGSYEISVLGSFDDGSELDVTHDAAWKIGNPAVVSIGPGPGGVARIETLGKGSSTVSATVGNVSLTVLTTVTD